MAGVVSLLRINVEGILNIGDEFPGVGARGWATLERTADREQLEGEPWLREQLDILLANRPDLRDKVAKLNLNKFE